MLNYSPIKGLTDVCPDDYKYLTFLVKVFRHEFRKNGFRRISTSLIEREEIIDAVFGDNKDYLNKTELGYIRSNASVGIMRAYLDKEMYNEIQPIYNYYMANYFSEGFESYDGNRKIGGEIIGENDPILDAILIYIMYRVLNGICLENTFIININSIGVEKERVKYREELQNFYENKKHLLSDKSIKNLDIDSMLLLLSNEDDEKILANEAPGMLKFLKKDSKLHYKKFKEYLDLLNIPYNEDHTLVSKYDFNTNSIWEFRRKDNNQQIVFGTRHNVLSTKLGTQKEIPAVGFSTDSEVLIDMLKQNNIKIKNKDSIDLCFVQLGDEAKKVVLPFSLQAREAGINTIVSLGTPSMKEQMLKVSRSGAKFVVIVGLMEARNGRFQVRNNILGTQEEVNKENLIEYIIDKIGIKSLDFYCPVKDLINE